MPRASRTQAGTHDSDGREYAGGTGVRMATAPGEGMPEGAAGRPRVIGGVYRWIVRALNALQSGFFGLFWFVPDHSVLRQPHFQHVLVSLSLAYLALATISFGEIG